MVFKSSKGKTISLQDLYVLYDESMNWWEEYKKDSQALVWDRKTVRAHLDKGCNIYSSLYHARTNGGTIGPDLIKNVVDGKAMIADEILLHVYYNDLRGLLQYNFGKAASDPPPGVASDPPDGWKELCTSLNFALLDRATGKRFTALAIDLHAALLYIKDYPRDLARQLENYIRNLEASLHQEWHNRFSPEKAALMMVLQCWKFDLESFVSRTPNAIQVVEKTPDLPFPDREVTVRLSLIKQSATNWGQTEVVIKPTETSLHAIKISLTDEDTLSDESTFVHRERDWISGELNIAFKIIKQPDVSAIPDHLNFLISVLDFEEPVKEVKLDRNQFEVNTIQPISPFTKELTKDTDHLGEWYEECLKGIIASSAKLTYIIFCANGDIGDVATDAELIIRDLKTIAPSIRVVNLEEPGYKSTMMSGNQTGMAKESLVVIRSREPELDKLIPEDISRLSSPRVILLEEFSMMQKAKIRKQNIARLSNEARVLLFGLEEFLQYIFPNVKIDVEATNHLMHYFMTIRERNLPNKICERLADQVKWRGFPYIDEKDVQAVWQDSIFLVKRALERACGKLQEYHKIVLTKLSYHLSPDDKVPLSSIVPVVLECKDKLPDDKSVVEVLHEISSWFEKEDGYLWKFADRVHWEFVRQLSG